MIMELINKPKETMSTTAGIYSIATLRNRIDKKYLTLKFQKTFQRCILTYRNVMKNGMAISIRCYI